MANHPKNLDLDEIAIAMAEDPGMASFAHLVEEAYDVPTEHSFPGYVSGTANDLPVGRRLLALEQTADAQFGTYLFRLLEIGPLTQDGIQQTAVVELLGVALTSWVGIAPVSSHFIHAISDFPLRYAQTFFFHTRGVTTVEKIALSNIAERFPDATGRIANAISAISLVLLGQCTGGPQ
ncbi:MAG: hypothetical protein N4A70_17495 [Pelagimonas sp.]|jgi:hypothetical protein|nr:hypothetical protein [Pelagimonas sp.]